MSKFKLIINKITYPFRIIANKIIREDNSISNMERAPNRSEKISSNFKSITNKLTYPFHLIARKIVRADETILSDIDKLPRKWVLHIRSYLEMVFCFVFVIFSWGVLTEYLDGYPEAVTTITILIMTASIFQCVLIHLERERWWIISMIKIEKNIDINKDEIK